MQQVKAKATYKQRKEEKAKKRANNVHHLLDQNVQKEGNLLVAPHLLVKLTSRHATNGENLANAPMVIIANFGTVRFASSGRSASVIVAKIATYRMWKSFKVKELHRPGSRWQP